MYATIVVTRDQEVPDDRTYAILWATTRGSADGINWDNTTFTDVNNTPCVPTAAVTGIKRLNYTGTFQQ